MGAEGEGRPVCQCRRHTGEPTECHPSALLFWSVRAFPEQLRQLRCLLSLHSHNLGCSTLCLQATLEAMKMESAISAPRDAVIRHIRIAEGQLVQQGSPLMLLE